MQSIGVKELRDNISRIIRKVENGETVRVMRHGKGVLELHPITVMPEQRFSEQLKKKGVLSGGSGKINPVKTVKNLKPEKLVSNLVIEERR